MDKRTRILCEIMKLDYNVDLTKHQLRKVTFDLVNGLTLIATSQSDQVRVRRSVDIELLAYLLYNVMGVMDLMELVQRLRLETLPLMLHFDKFETSDFVLLPNQYAVLSMDRQLRMGNCLKAKLIPFLPSQLAN
jgi:hypothetical protein